MKWHPVRLLQPAVHEQLCEAATEENFEKHLNHMFFHKMDFALEDARI